MSKQELMQTPTEQEHHRCGKSKSTRGKRKLNTSLIESEMPLYEFCQLCSVRRCKHQTGVRATASLTLNLYCVLLFRPCTVQVKFSPVYFGWKSVPCGRKTVSSLCVFLCTYITFFRGVSASVSSAHIWIEQWLQFDQPWLWFPLWVS